MKSNNEKSHRNPERSAKAPEKRRSEHGKSEYPRETELKSHLSSGSDTSYSEQIDVSPPKRREFPSVGNAKGDFAARKLGRVTGTMLGHEPGIENGI